jgi:SNF family Na+-dependent transporter
MSDEKNDVLKPVSAEDENDSFGPEITHHEPREAWGSKLGLILAMAGNAVGLGNFLRFPCKAAANGGGAFMIPYFIAFIFLGIPLMWIEWALGRFGGRHGHGTLPAIFNRIWKNPLSKYIGALGIVLPLLIVIYYNYIESWTLAYGYFSVSGKYSGIHERQAMETFLEGYTGQTKKKSTLTVPAAAGSDASAQTTGEITIAFDKYYGDGIYRMGFEFRDENDKPVIGSSEFAIYHKAAADMVMPSKTAVMPAQIESIHPGAGDTLAAKPDSVRIKFKSAVRADSIKVNLNWDNNYFNGYKTALFFFLITFLINVLVLYKGVESGIEALAKIAMPTLVIFAIILAIRVLTLTPLKASALDGLGFIWNPDLSMLTNANVWLAAAGQIFFTLSICTGAIQTYASFVKDSEDIVLTGLTTAATNEFCEIILGGTIAIPASVMFFGAAETAEIAKSGAFNLGFSSMPVIFQQIPLGNVLGAMWFGLLFFAGITSSVALSYPAIVFLKDELDYTHAKAVSLVAGIMFAAAMPVIFFFDRGFLDEMDFWAGTFGLAIFGFVELVYFCWIFGMDNAWEEMHHGHAIKIPKVFYYIIKYVTPAFILALMLVWGYQDGIGMLTMKGVPEANVPVLWGARLLMASVVVFFCFMIKKAWDLKGQVHA